MSYGLGIDLGTSYSAAAVARGAQADPVPLGADSAQIPSVVLFRDDGEVLVGEAAEQQAAIEPTRAAREFKRRLGDAVPIVVAGVPHPAEELMVHLLRSIVQTTTELQGSVPERVVLTHPANYSEHKTGLLLQASLAAGLPEHSVSLLTEPEAAAVAYSRQHRIEPGEVVAIYDFGGGTFDAALVQRTTQRFELIGVPDGMERLGGIDIDQAILANVDAAVGGALSSADRNDPATFRALAKVRSECRRAKERLSTDDTTIVLVPVRTELTEVRVSRADLEAMVRPRITDTVRALERAVASAGLRMPDVSRILLVGGTSRMPLVAEMVAAATGRPVTLDAHPKLAIAVGAALMGAAQMSALPVSPAAMAAPMLPPPAPPTPATATPLVPAAPLPRVVAPPPPAPEAQVDEWTAPALSTQRRARPPEATASVRSGSGRLLKFAASVGALVGLVLVGVIAFSRDDRTSSTPGDIGSPPLPLSVDGSEPGVPVTVDRLAFDTNDAIVGLATDTSGGVYVVTGDGQVSKVVDGTVSEVGRLAAADGAPGGIAVRSDGSVFVSTTVGVTVFDGGAARVALNGAEAGLGAISGPLALDEVGNLYVADNGHHRVIRLGADGGLNLVAGNGEVATGSDAVGDGEPAQTVPLGTVSGLAVDGSGNLLIADRITGLVRAVAVDGTIRTIVGGGSTPVASFVDGAEALGLRFDGLAGLGVDNAGRMYLSDAGADVLLRVSNDGRARVIIAKKDGVAAANGVPANASSVADIGPVAVGRSGDVVFADGRSIRAIASP